MSLQDRAEIARCLQQWEDDTWDKQIKEDIAAGKLDKLLSRVDADIEQGKRSDLP